MANLGICVTDKCCAPGTIYSEKENQCVVPPTKQGFTNYSALEGLSTGTGMKGTLSGGSVSPYSPHMAFASL